MENGEKLGGIAPSAAKMAQLTPNGAIARLVRGLLEGVSHAFAHIQEGRQ